MNFYRHLIFNILRMTENSEPA